MERLSLEPLSRLLLQRAVQTQVCYFHEFHDEPKAQWLASFGSPAVSMEAESVSDRSCQPRYAGLNGYCDAAVEYLTAMVQAEPVHYSVRYELGTSKAASTALPDGFAETASAAWDMWASTNHAAQSRRRNPFLTEAKKAVEYEETLEPTYMARQLMRTRSHVTSEFEADVGALARQARGHLLAIDDDGGSSPLRYGSVDLCERLATREAALAVAEDASPAVARFVLRVLETSPSSDQPPPPPEDPLLAELAECCRLTRKDALGDHARQRGLAADWLEHLRQEDSAVADRIEQQRALLYEAWADEVVGLVADEHLEVDRLLLEQQLAGGWVDLPDGDEVYPFSSSSS